MCLMTADFNSVLLALLSLSVVFFFLRLFFFSYLYDFIWIRFLRWIIGPLHFHQRHFLPHTESSPEQLPNAGSILGINSRPLICLTCHEKNEASNGHETQSIVQLLNSLWKSDTMFKNGCTFQKINTVSLISKSIVVAYRGRTTEPVLLSKY